MSAGLAGSVGESGQIGEMLHPPGRIRMVEGRIRIRLSVTNTSARPVRISSHYPLWRANARLAFDREAALGFRLDIPAGSSVRWAPGETLEVELVAYGGTTGPREP
jgi:urease beta subunit